MKRVSFCEQTRVYFPIMHGEVHWIQKEPLSSEEDILRRRSRFQKLRQDMRSTLHLSQTLRCKKTTNRGTFAKRQCSVAKHGHGHSCY